MPPLDMPTASTRVRSTGCSAAMPLDQRAQEAEVVAGGVARGAAAAAGVPRRQPPTRQAAVAVGEGDDVAVALGGRDEAVALVVGHELGMPAPAVQRQHQRRRRTQAAGRHVHQRAPLLARMREPQLVRAGREGRGRARGKQCDDRRDDPRLGAAPGPVLSHRHCPWARRSPRRAAPCARAAARVRATTAAPVVRGPAWPPR